MSTPYPSYESTAVSNSYNVEDMDDNEELDVPHIAKTPIITKSRLITLIIAVVSFFTLTLLVNFSRGSTAKIAAPVSFAAAFQLDPSHSRFPSHQTSRAPSEESSR